MRQLMKMRRTGLACITSMFFLALPSSGTEVDTEMAVQVSRKGEALVIDVSFVVAATQLESWNVLTDFDHMHEFVTSLLSSKVVHRDGNRLQVAQVGKASQGVLSFTYDAVREIELVPHHTIRTHLLSGNMSKLDGMTSLRAESGHTRVIYHGESIPNSWVPPILAEKFIERQVYQQYREMRIEILKRKNAASLALRDVR